MAKLTNWRLKRCWDLSSQRIRYLSLTRFMGHHKLPKPTILGDSARRKCQVTFKCNQHVIRTFSFVHVYRSNVPRLHSIFHSIILNIFHLFHNGSTYPIAWLNLPHRWGKLSHFTIPTLAEYIAFPFYCARLVNGLKCTRGIKLQYKIGKLTYDITG